MKVTVTQDNIDKGEQGLPGHCPVARALNDLGFPNVSVSQHFIYLTSQDGGTCPPWDVQEFISNFDNGREVKPFTFELEGPNES